MGSIKTKETESINGMVVVIEYEFSDYKDYLDLLERRSNMLKDAIDSGIMNVNVKKRETKH